MERKIKKERERGGERERTWKKRILTRMVKIREQKFIFLGMSNTPDINPTINTHGHGLRETGTHRIDKLNEFRSIHRPRSIIATIHADLSIAPREKSTRRFLFYPSSLSPPARVTAYPSRYNIATRNK